MLKANLYIYMVPLITLLVSVLFLHERITVMGLLGILLVIAGMALGTVQTKKGPLPLNSLIRKSPSPNRDAPRCNR